MAANNVSKKRKCRTPMVPADAVAGTESRKQVPVAGDYLQVKWMLEESESEGEVWWPCKVVTMDDEARTGSILYSTESTGPGLDLMDNSRDSCEAEAVEMLEGGMRHTEQSNEPVLEWRFTKTTEAVVQSSSMGGPETSNDVGGNLALHNKVAKLERAITTLATTRFGPRALSSSRAPSRVKSVLHVLARSEAYRALFKKDPKSAKNFISKGLGPISGCDVVSPSHIASRGTNCTLHEFQEICAFIATGMGHHNAMSHVGELILSPSTFTGRHGMMRMRPSAFGVLFPNLETCFGAHRDAMVVEFEAYGDMLDCLGMTETPRLITLGTARERGDVKNWVWVVGTSIWVQGGSGDGDGGNKPVRHLFPCRSPFGQSHPDLSPALYDSDDSLMEKDGVCNWEVELLTQTDTTILKVSDKTMVSSFEAKTKKSKDVSIELGKQLDDVEDTGSKFGIAWNPSTQGIPKGVVGADVPGLLTCRFPVTIVRTKQLADSVLSLLDHHVAGTNLADETKARTDRLLRPPPNGNVNLQDEQLGESQP